MGISPNVVVVTGGNRGLGFELVRRLADRFRHASVYLTSRNKESGLAAVRKLSDQGLKPCYHKLDVTRVEDAETLKETLVGRHGNHPIDILVNNAGINLGSNKNIPVGERAEDTMKVNYFGIINVCETLFPILRPGARVLNLASMMAKPIRNQLSEEIRKKMDSEDLSLEELNSLMASYVKYAKNGNHNEMGYCNHAYGISKYAVISLTRILARVNQNPGVLINCCCPGWVRTDMGGPNARTSVEKGVETLLDCVLLPEGAEPNGKFILQGKVFNLS